MNVNDIPTYWFALLEQARERGNYEAAARAQRELGRLGVRVKFNTRRPVQEGRTRRHTQGGRDAR
jgi:hypothetical protein